MGKTRDIAFCQRVQINRPEDDRGGAGRGSRNCSLQYGILADDDDVDAVTSKFAHRRHQAVRIIILDEIDRQAAAFDITQLAQPIFKGSVCGMRAWAPGNDTDAENAGRRLFGFRRKHARDDEPEQQSHAEEPASCHSMTSSARSRRAGGTVRPSALAVLRLMISEYLVGC